MDFDFIAFLDFLWEMTIPLVALVVVLVLLIQEVVFWWAHLSKPMPLTRLLVER